MIELENEKKYRSVINRIAGTMLIFLALTNTLAMLGMALDFVWDMIPNEMIADIAGSLTDGVVYILGFMLPACFFRLVSKGKRVEPMKLSPKLPFRLPESETGALLGAVLPLGAAQPAAHTSSKTRVSSSAMILRVFIWFPPVHKVYSYKRIILRFQYNIIRFAPARSAARRCPPG